MIRAFLLTSLALLIAAVSTARAQQDQAPNPVTLIADVIELDGDTRITATGHVEIFSNQRSIRAAALSYDRATDLVSITGPIVIQDGNDRAIFAQTAEIDPALRDGVMTGARLVLREQMQIAGAEMRRRAGRFTELSAVVASSCRVCNEHEDPLWEIRASRVIHDEDSARIWFYNARFRVLGVPIFYLPVFRAPDGTVDRVAGFLTPSLQTTTQLGSGVKLPYFFPIGRSADLTMTPYVSGGYTRTLEMRYRQMFTKGEIQFNGALSRDSILRGSNRGYLFGQGRFDIPRGFELTFDIETTLDDPYLQDYGYSSVDRLRSGIGVLRTQAGERIEAEALYYQSLRTDEDNNKIPTLIGNFQWNRRWQVEPVGGWLDVDLIGEGHMRPSDRNQVGRDMAQTRAVVSWSRRWTGLGGLRFAADLRAHGDVKYIGQDNSYDELQTAITPIGAIEAGLPLVATDAGGVRYLLEPLVQLAWTAPDRLSSPNDDSTLVAFDTGNLLALNRFPGLDRTEQGARANVALRWSRLDPDGWSIGATAGKVYRRDHQDQFPRGTGLFGPSSDWLTQIDLDFGQRFMLRNLLLFDNGFEPTTNDLRLSWHGQGLDLSASYVWQRADRAFDLDDDLSELAFDTLYRINENWSAGLDLRRDLTEGRTNRAELGVVWQNECVRVDLSALRRFRATEDIEPTTSYGLSVTLAGFGVNQPQSVGARSCASPG
ncbi:MAG: LPS-assembly protein LptD [Qingshengfaniella sp.]